MMHGSTNLLLASEVYEPELTASPTNRLMLAVLEEALVTFQKGLGARGAQERQRCCEVDRWVASSDERPLFSFENICSSLRIDPAYVREGLAKLRVAARQGQDFGSPRRALRRERMYGRRAWRGRIRA